MLAAFLARRHEVFLGLLDAGNGMMEGLKYCLNKTKD